MELGLVGLLLLLLELAKLALVVLHHVLIWKVLLVLMLYLLVILRRVQRYGFVLVLKVVKLLLSLAQGLLRVGWRVSVLKWVLADWACHLPHRMARWPFLEVGLLGVWLVVRLRRLIVRHIAILIILVIIDFIRI